MPVLLLVAFYISSFLHNTVLQWLRSFSNLDRSRSI